VSATNELIDVLLCEQNIYSRLLSTSEEKRAAIIENKRERLLDILSVETDLLADAGGLEKKRAALAQKLARQSGIEGNHFRLSALAEKTEDPTLRDRLTQIGADFSKTLGKLAELNKTNAELLKQRKEYTVIMLDAILGGGQSCDVYDRTGSTGTARTWSGLIDRQV
jgi:hypothetical protein